MDPGTHATNYLSSKKRNIAIDINDMAHTLNDKFIFMKINLLPLLLFLSSSVVAQEPDSSSALFKMREAEQNFA